MQIERIPFDQVNELSGRDKAYVSSDNRLEGFYKYKVELSEFEKVIHDKAIENVDRENLVSYLHDQYDGLVVSEKTKQNISALTSSKTFTIITAHQPSLFTGPLYYIYKICSAINLSRQLNDHYPDYNFVPVFVTGGEDHDFEEMNHLNLYNKSIVWQNDESGSVGAMHTQSLKPALDQVKEILGDQERAVEVFEILRSSHEQHKNYAAATIDMVNQFFGAYGLVIANMNTPLLKKIFIPIIKKEIFEQPSFDIVNKTIQQLEAEGFKGQASPREINFFYLRDQIRNRIVKEGETYKVLNSGFEFTKDELNHEIENHPERFSPNVIMRPIYQELVFPNLAYIGGGGELAYWLERKEQFEYFGINFPMLIRRNSALWIDKAGIKRLSKLGLNWKDLFSETESLVKQFVHSQSKEEINLSEYKTRIEEVYNEISGLAAAIDPTLKQKVLGEGAKTSKGLDMLEGRIIKAEKSKHDVAINQLRALKEKYFPNNGLQERKDNFLPWYLKFGRTYFELLIEHLNPLDKNFLVFLEEAK